MSGFTTSVLEGALIPVVVRHRPFAFVSLTTLADADRVPVMHFRLVDRVALSFGLIWRWRLTLRQIQGAGVLMINFNSWSGARTVTKAVRALVALSPLLSDENVLVQIAHLERDLVPNSSPRAWVDSRSMRLALLSARKLQSEVSTLPIRERNWLVKHIFNGLVFLKSDLELERCRASANARFYSSAKERFGAFLDKVEKRSLSEEQRSAVLKDEHRTLVVAAAGSGKTSALVAKSGYLVESGITRSEQICIIAFNKKASAEVQNRVKSQCNIVPTVKTFHALGLEILGQSTGTRKRIAPVLEQDKSRRALLCELVRQDLNDHPDQAPAYLYGSDAIRDHLDALARAKSEKTTATPWWERWLQSERSSTPVSKVRISGKESARRATEAAQEALIEGRSPQEVDILRFLRGRGLIVFYEPVYELPTADTNHAQYRPDFLIKTTAQNGVALQVYLEHQALNRQGRSSFGPSYESKVKWVRELHISRTTTLVESFSWWWRDESVHWTTRLSSALTAKGIVMSDLAAIERDKALELLVKESPAADQRQDLSPVTKLFYESLDRFISLARERGASTDPSVEDASCNVPGGSDLLRVFLRVLHAYERWLSASDGLDFPAMIADSAAAVRQGQYVPSWTHLLIDEFQDISAGRMALISALLQAQPAMKLFAVGDDWQAINRFAGADIAIMSGLNRTVEDKLLTLLLPTTFRCAQRIVDVSSRFILENSSQIRKDVRADSVGPSEPAITLHFEDQTLRDKNGRPPTIERILQEVAARHIRGADVLVLARYGFFFETTPEIDRWIKLVPQLSVNVSTIHSAKGREADVVIVLGLDSGLYGFPSRRDDLPVLQTVLPDVDRSIADAEERRLLYVGLTRARREAHLIVSERNPSPFADELAAYGPNLVRINRSDIPVTKECPACRKGNLMAADGQFGRYFTCSAKCGFKEEACPICKRGLVDTEGIGRRCQESTCRADILPCLSSKKPKCTGWLFVKLNKKTGNEFLGCSNYRLLENSCKYTRPYIGEYE